MKLFSEFESWSWVAGIISAIIALITLIWQMRVAMQRTSRKGDWEVMDRAFHGIRIGAPITTLQKLGLTPIDRNGSGALKITKFLLASGNDLSVTYNSTQDRILYMEIDWNQKTTGAKTGLGALRFGHSTLQQIRHLYKSNGFSHAKHIMFEMEEGIVTFNCFELKQTPTIIVVFITKLSNTTRKYIETLPPEKQVMNEIGDYFKLDAIAVADETYLDEIWGHEKIYDPKSIPITL